MHKKKKNFLIEWNMRMSTSKLKKVNSKEVYNYKIRMFDGISWSLEAGKRVHCAWPIEQRHSLGHARTFGKKISKIYQISFFDNVMQIIIIMHALMMPNGNEQEWNIL